MEKEHCISQMDKNSKDSSKEILYLGQVHSIASMDPGYRGIGFKIRKLIE